MESTRASKFAAWALAGCLTVGVGAGMVGCSSSDTGSSSRNSSAATTQTSNNGVQQVNVTLTATGVTVEPSTVEAGVVTFNITNESAPAISECELLFNQKIIGEKENLAPGLDTVSFTVTLNGGNYRIYTPGADNEYTDFTVTGEAAAAPQGSTQEILQEGVTAYGQYIQQMTESLKTTTAALDEAVQSGDVEAAKKAYATARPYYERAESAVDGFLMPGSTDVEDNTQNLDYLIDMRESNFDEDAGWHGFHAIERDLWQNGVITDSTKEFSKELADNAAILNDKVIPTFTEDLSPEDLANGAADLLEEVSTTKITGEEEAYSKLDLLDFRANVEGAQQAYANLRDGLNEIDPDLVSKIDAEFDTVVKATDAYIDDSVLGGYKLYTDELKASDAQKLTNVILPLHDDIASLAEKVATA